MKKLLIPMLLLFFNYSVDAQKYTNAYCKDITSQVSIDKVGGEDTFVVALNKNDTLEFKASTSGGSELIASVVNHEETVMNILCRNPDSSYNHLIIFQSYTKNGKEWKHEFFLNPLTPRYMGENMDIVDVLIPDMNTLIVRYKLENGRIADRLFRITKTGAVEYDCYKDDTIEVKDDPNNIFRLAHPIKNGYRPNN